MSLFSGITSWIESRLDTQVAALTNVKAITTPEEFSILGGRHTPAAGIMVASGVATDSQTLGQSSIQLIEIKIDIWVSSRMLRGGKDLDNTNGIYDLFDAIQTAMKNQVPTGADSSFRYISHEIDVLDGGLAVMQMQYVTTAQI